MENLKKNLVCPKCRCSLCNDDSGSLFCSSCQGRYNIINGTPDFRKKDEYWCNVSRKKMAILNTLAEESGDWLDAARKIVPEYIGHFASFERADGQFLWPTTKDSRILDAGSMWGGITIPAAQFHGEIYAIDKTVETLEFLKIRAAQMRLNNICTVASGLRELPFSNGFFDLVILNGVLEWVGLDEEVVLERDWKKFGRGCKVGKTIISAENPKMMQLQVLKEAQRVLKPGGSLYLAIENRMGYIYLAGYPDDHMNLPFVCFMPRFLSNAVTKLMFKCEYRTYVYSIPGYRSLLKQSGYGHMDFYGAFTHYINPSEVVPFDLIKGMKNKILSTKKGINRLLLKLVPAGLLKWLCPSVIVTAQKGNAVPNAGSRLGQLLVKAGLLRDSSGGIKIMKYGSRPGNDLTVNYAVYWGNETSPRFFCKICRSKTSTAVLDKESENLKKVQGLLNNTGLASSVPRLLYCGTIDDITFMVMDYIEARRASFDFNDRLRSNMVQLDRELRAAVGFLADFQKRTKIESVKAIPYLCAFLDECRHVLNEKGLLTGEIVAAIYQLKEEINALGETMIPLCSQHGDYDFFYNILFKDNDVKIVDFEHFDPKALPFLDMGTLTLNPILVSYEYVKGKLPLEVLIKKYKLREHLSDWFGLYSGLTGLPKEIARLIPALAALEQRTRECPASRDPETFPINKAFKELLSFRIDIK